MQTHVYKADDVAQFIINYYSKQNRLADLSFNRLHILLYFVQEKFLIETEFECFSCRIQASFDGPVIKEAGESLRRAKKHVPHAPVIVGFLDSERITQVLDVYNSWSTWQLYDLYFSRESWIQANENHDRVISLFAIRQSGITALVNGTNRIPRT